MAFDNKKKIQTRVFGHRAPATAAHFLIETSAHFLIETAAHFLIETT